MFTWHAHETAVTALAFGPAGRFLVSAGADECVRVWDSLTGSEQYSISLRIDDMLRVAGDPTGPPHHLVVADDGKCGAIVNPQAGIIFLNFEQCRETSALLPSDVRVMKPAPGGASLFALASEQRGPFFGEYDFEGRAVTNSVQLPDWRSPDALGVSPDGSRVAVGTTLFEWPPSNAYPAKGGIHTKDYDPIDLAFSADNQHLFALVGGKIVVYSLPDGLFKTKLKGHNGRITAMALTPDGTRLWTASHDATVKCWDTHSLTLDRTYTFQTGGLDCLAVSPDGNVAAVGSGQKGTITLWDLE